MRKFVISDIHGNGDIYDTIMGYLDNISEVEEVELFINGDLIDRGLDSFRVLMDVVERINGNGNIKIHYLGGNHEQLMYRALKVRLPGRSIDHLSDWMHNGGLIIEDELDAREDGEELCDYFRDFMGDLKIFHLFDERIKDKPILLVHAQAPTLETLGKDLRIKDGGNLVFDALWTRRERRSVSIFMPGDVIGHNRIGSDDFFTIKGHTEVRNPFGFEIDTDENYINIDGCCASFATGNFKRDKVPLLEIKPNGIEITVFNHNNEIVYGYFYDGELTRISEEELDCKRKYINLMYNEQEKTYKKRIKEYIAVENE